MMETTMIATATSEREARGEAQEVMLRLSPPAALLLVTALSLGLWAAIWQAVSAMFRAGFGQ